MRRFLAICGFALGFGAIGYAVTLIVKDTPKKAPEISREDIVIDEIDIGEATMYGIVPTHLRIHNNSQTAIRFIGGPNGCQPGGCIRTLGPCPLEIEAGTTVEIPLEVSVSAEGSVRLQVDLYLDLAGVGVERTTHLAAVGLPPDKNATAILKP